MQTSPRSIQAWSFSSLHPGLPLTFYFITVCMEMMKALFYFIFFFPNTFGKIFQAVSFMAEYCPWPIYMLIAEVLPFTDKYLHVN